MSHKNVLIISVFASLFFMIFTSTMATQCEGFGCVAQGLGYATMYYLLIPLVLSIASFASAREERIKHALQAFGLALLTAVILSIPAYIQSYKDNQRNQNENIYIDPGERKGSI